MTFGNPIKLFSMFGVIFQEIQHDSSWSSYTGQNCFQKRIVDYATCLQQFTGNTIRLPEIAIFWSLILKVLESGALTNISRNTRGIYSDD